MNTPQLEQWLTAQQDTHLRMRVSSLAARLAIEQDLDVPTARYEALLHHYLKYTPRAHPIGPAPPASAFRRGGKQVSFMGTGGSKVAPEPEPEPEFQRPLTLLDPTDTHTYGRVKSREKWAPHQKTIYYKFIELPEEIQEIWYKEHERMKPIIKKFGNMDSDNVWLRNQGTHNLLMSKLSPEFKKAFPDLEWQEASLQFIIKPAAASPKEEKEEVMHPSYIPSPPPSHSSSRASSRSASPIPLTKPKRKLGEKVLFLPKTAPLPKGAPRPSGGQYPSTASYLASTPRGGSTSTGFMRKKRGGLLSR